MPQPNYEFTHPDYDRRKAEWKQNRDAVEGEAKIKAGKETYLPKPNPTDTSTENKARYDNYLQRAVFTNAAGRTSEGLVGIAFGDWPSYTLPKAMEYVLDNADGAGVGLMGQAQMAVGEILITGRGGILADYPKVEATASVADLESGKIAARTVWYSAEDIHDWSTTREGSLIKLSYVKLAEKRVERSADGFELICRDVYRLLRLEAGQYTVETLVKGDSGQWTSEGKSVILDAKGQPFDLIPFAFIGATNNDVRPDKAPLTDLVNVNLALYRNSADYEESVFMLGQPQVTMTGLDEEWRKYLEESGIYFGSRRVLTGPQGAAIGILQVQPNTLAGEAMKEKKADLVALGARLLEPGSAIKTAEQSKSEKRAAYSVLSLVCDNVSAAIKQALTWAARFMGASGEVDFAIDTEFDGLTFNAEIVKTIMGGVQSGLIPRSDAWNVLRKLNIIDQEKTDEEIKDEIDADGPSLSSILDPLNPAKAKPGDKTGAGAPGGAGGSAQPGAPAPTGGTGSE